MKNTAVSQQLKTYRRKRDFDVTPEPEGSLQGQSEGLAQEQPKDSAQKKLSVDTPLFVVQKHAARRLHYDFRLELGGTLKSWAVPKGPSLDPSIKRMAVHVEDHPLSYADFEGTIPAGNYGAGTVIVWDIGTWRAEGDAQAGYEKGHLRFELHGKKLRGHWHLVRTHGLSNSKNGEASKESWLLIKQRDDAARPAAQYDVVEAMPDSVLRGTANKSASARAAKKPESALTAGKPAAQPLMLAPQLATLVDTPPRDGGWIYEIKFDGYRILTRINVRDGIRLFTRNGNDWTARLKLLQSALAQRKLDDAWLDGEIIALDANGISNFQKLQNAFEQHRPTQIVYMLFDIPYYRGHDLRHLPLWQRRQWLRELLADGDGSVARDSAESIVRFSEHIDAQRDDLLDVACAMHVEGLIGKRADSMYTSGRTRDWIKLKCVQRQEFVIGGYTEASNKNVRAIGALLLGVHDEHGKLRYAGKVGTGFTQQSAIVLHEKMQPLLTTKSPFADSVRQAQVHWVKPKLLAEIAFAQWTDDGHIRHSSFQGLRSDKPATAITRELPLPIADAASSNSTPANTKAKRMPTEKLPITKKKSLKTNTSSRTRKSPSARRDGKSQTPTAAAEHAIVAGIAISHPDRIIDAESGTTKLDLVRYYEGVSAQLLMHLKDRPVSLVRAPTGVGGEIFFQKHRGSLHIPELTELDAALLPAHPPLIAIDSLAGVIHCVQMNVVEFHTWNARLAHIEQPDRIVFDLDPGEGIVWTQVVEAAQLMKAVLDELHLKSFLKTSGGKGLHVIVPLAPRDDWQSVREFSEALVRHLARTLPQLFVATSGPKNRIGRIFIDYLRNHRGSTTVAAFSARLRPGLGVSVPLAWEELRDLKSSAAWQVSNIDAGIAAERARCWQSYGRVKQTLARAQKALSADQ